MSQQGLESYRRPTGRFGRDFRYFREVGSTNDVALAAARSGAAEGLVVIADRQSKGRGRLQRRWEAPVGSSLLMSLLFRPPDPFAYFAERITMVCGLSLVLAVGAVTGVAARLKWPNDLIHEAVDAPGDWLKLAGMLSEVVLSDAGQPVALVVGLGVNVNVAAGDLPDLAPNAGSLSVLTGAEVSRVDLLDMFLGETESRYADLLCGVDPVPAWREQLAWLGRPVVVHAADGIIQGIAEDIDAEGALVLRLPGGGTRRFLAGDVSLRPIGC